MTSRAKPTSFSLFEDFDSSPKHEPEVPFLSVSWLDAFALLSSYLRGPELLELEIKTAHIVGSSVVFVHLLARGF